MSLALLLTLLLVAASACFTYRAIPNAGPSATSVGGSQGAATDPKGEVVWSFLWGLVQESPTIDNCNQQDLAEVTVRSNLGFSLLTVITLGIVSPAHVEWRCALPRPEEGEIGEDEPDPPAPDTVRRDTTHARGGR